MELLLTSLVLSALGLAGGFGFWRSRKHYVWRQQIDTNDSLFHAGEWNFFRFIIDDPYMTSKHKWTEGLFIITHKRIAVYQYPHVNPVFTIQPHELRGFWRPTKYTSEVNEMWVHAQIGLSWCILKFRLYQTSMMKCVRAMKEISTDEQTKAYRRRRPYIHREPSPAHPATQNLQGAWELEPPLSLYIMPLHLVLLNHQQEVVNVLDLADIQNIAALKRMEGGKPDGLVRFTHADETYAFAMDDYEAWASDLAEAAKRTLEEPVTQKRKGKYGDDDYDFEDE